MRALPDPRWDRIRQSLDTKLDEGNSISAMNELGYIQNHPREQFARLHYFSINKLQDGAEIEMNITVREFFAPPIGALQFFAQADKQTNQKVAPYTPSGWGSSLRDALIACVREINRFPYQAESNESAAV